MSLRMLFFPPFAPFSWMRRDLSLASTLLAVDAAFSFFSPSFPVSLSFSSPKPNFWNMARRSWMFFSRFFSYSERPAVSLDSFWTCNVLQLQSK